jgi:putative exosortase-associated protein (TIGR04073 family)
MRLRLQRILAATAALAISVPALTASAEFVEVDTDGAGDKALRGLAAMGAPFLEIPGNITYTTEEHGPFAGWTEGLARGLGMSLLRPPVGFYELVTAPFAVPPFGPILRPEYPWSYFGDGYADDSLLNTAEHREERR